uniref:AT-hook motif nuclear-localized protein n=1 Tax=Aegilops tauschii subsp. strangulata TaxID=200361 RepID=A0A453RKD1_AEGTS
MPLAMEVRSEQGLMAGRDLFGLPKSQPAPAPAAPAAPPSSAAMQSVRMAYTADGTPVFAPVSSAVAPPGYQPAGGNGVAAPPGMGEPSAKKKRGRPRKYGPDAAMSLALVTVPTAAGSPAVTQGASGRPFSPTLPGNFVPSASPDGGKKRGRPKGSTNKPRVDVSPKFKLFCRAGRSWIHTSCSYSSSWRGCIVKDYVIFSEWDSCSLCSLSKWFHIKCNTSSNWYIRWNCNI